ncbi:MAG: ACT domain-containing protein [Methanobacteriota archaeon]|nr:MAG: ACT domain-containing protein [Euryarchaeota archaeon]
MKFNFHSTREFKIKAENKPGSLHKIAELFGNHGINIDSISAFSTNDDVAVFRIITNDEATTTKVLEQNKGVVLGYDVGDVVVVTLDNKPGELAKLTDRLRRRGINLESLYVVSTGEKTEVAIKAPDVGAIKEALEE